MRDTTRETKIYYIARFFVSLAIALCTGLIFTWSIMSNIIPLLVLSVIFLAFSLFPLIVRLKDLILVFYYVHKIREHEDEILSSGNVISYDGLPGAGKTLSMTYDGVLLAEHNYNDLMLEYLLRQGRFKNPDKKTENRFNNYDDYWRFKAVEDTVNFYSDNPDIIPLLVSNYSIKVEDCYSSKLKSEHFLQYERMPELAVWLFDESADLLSNQRSFAKHNSLEYFENQIINKTTSKERHYGLWRMIFAEQDSNENFIGVRRVVSINRFLEGLIKVMLPKRLIKKRDKLYEKIFKNEDCTFEQYLKVNKLSNKISKIGFFKIFYQDSKKYGESKKVINEGFYCLPLHLPFEYETRAFMFEYDGFKLPLDLEKHNSLYNT